jgi:cell wall-associated NlpC family hydrolase
MPCKHQLPVPASQNRQSPIRAVSLLLLCFFLLTTAACTKRNVYFPPESTSHFIPSPTEKSDTADALREFYKRWQGTPYGRGSVSQSKIDCSGLTLVAYKDIFDMELPRTAADQADAGDDITIQDLQPGDLVFFKTGRFQEHVGIYLEENTFIHASSTKGVMVSHLDEPYWKRQYWKASRISR